MRLTALLVLASFGAQPPGFALDPRGKPSEYPVQVEGKDFVTGAEYTVRSLLAEGASFAVDNYLLVEVGVYPTRPTNVHLERFSLRINGKNVLMPQTPGMVAGSLKYPDWTRRPALEAEAGPIIFGRRQPVARFPGDPREVGVPRPPAPAQDQGVSAEPVDYSEVLKRAALPEGNTSRPVAGYIFFAFDGKLKSIRTVELLVDGVPLKLR